MATSDVSTYCLCARTDAFSTTSLSIWWKRQTPNSEKTPKDSSTRPHSLSMQSVKRSICLHIPDLICETGAFFQYFDQQIAVTGCFTSCKIARTCNVAEEMLILSSVMLTCHEQLSNLGSMDGCAEDDIRFRITAG